MTYRLGWFATGRGSGSYGLLTEMQQAIQIGYAPAEIAFVFMSREAGEGDGSDRFIELVKSYNIPLIKLSYRKFKAQYGDDSGSPYEMPAWRLDYDREVMRRLEPFSVDLSVLAGYMLVVGPEMCARYDMLNLHPALPDGPKGTWIEVIWELIRSGASQSGVMTHLVTSELDRGPVVSYTGFPIHDAEMAPLWDEIKGLSLDAVIKAQGEDNPLFAEIRARGVVRERPLVTASVKAFAEGNISINTDRQPVDAAGNIITGGYDLTAEIDRLVADA